MYKKGEFGNLDEMLEAVIGWDLQLLPLQKGNFSSRILQLGLSNTLLSEAEFLQKVEQKGSTPKGFRTFVIPKKDTVHYYWRGNQIQGRMMSLFPPSGELYSVSNDSFSVYTISLSEHIIERALEFIRSSEVEHRIKGEAIWLVEPQRLQMIRNLISRILTSYKNNPNFNSFHLELELAIQLLGSMESQNMVHKARKNRSTQALEKSLKLISAISHDSFLKVSSLCKETNISERMLQYAFLQRFGMTPKEYIKNYRLRMIRRKLRQGHDYQWIYQIASEYGYWHMGQFSADYKSHFNELPSQTRSAG